MNFSLEVKGVERLRRELESHGPRARQALAAALYQEAQTVMTQSKQEVPVDLGVLKNSGEVHEPEIGPDGTISVRMGFGGAASDYALIQHEDLTLKHPNGGGPKFLERPFLQSLAGLGTRLGNRLAQALGHGRGGGPSGGAGSLGGNGTL